MIGRPNRRPDPDISTSKEVLEEMIFLPFYDLERHPKLAFQTS